MRARDQASDSEEADAEEAGATSHRAFARNALACAGSRAVSVRPQLSLSEAAADLASQILILETEGTARMVVLQPVVQEKQGRAHAVRQPAVPHRELRGNQPPAIHSPAHVALASDRAVTQATRRQERRLQDEAVDLHEEKIQHAQSHGRSEGGLEEAEDTTL